MIGKVETDTINRERSNNQYNSHKSSTNNLLKMTKKNDLYQLKLRKWKGEKIFGKIRPYKQRHEERFETVEIKNYDESETNNNDQQNEHTVIEPNMQDLPNQVEKNVSNSVRDNFFLYGQEATKANQRKN